LKTKLLYLAQPYSHRYRYKRKERFIRGCQAAAQLMDLGYDVFSPIAHSHSVEVEGMKKRRTGKFWLKQDFAVLRGCDAVVVLTMKGWEKSKGVRAEMKEAKRLGIPITFQKESELQMIHELLEA